MSHSTPKFTVGQAVKYTKPGYYKLLTIVEATYDNKPGGPLYKCSDGYFHREWNLAAEYQVDDPLLTEEKKAQIAEQQKAQAASIEAQKAKQAKILAGNPDSSVTKEHALKKWGIDTEMDLVEQAADFYLTNEAALDFPVLQQFADRQANHLAAQFSSYLSMAIGGELRHSKTKSYIKWASKNVVEILQELGKNGYSNSFYLNRNQAWLKWADIFKKRSKKQQAALIKTARRIFRKGKWNSAYGGNNWSLIAITLYTYLKGESSATTFVDTVFGLYHNCNLVLDKVWSVHELKNTLDENLKHDMKSLAQKASPSGRGVLSLYRRFQNES